MPGAYAFGRLVVALDGVLLDVPYTPANIAAFGPLPSRHGSAGFPQVRLITTLTGPRAAPAAHLAACYAQRWEIETSYREIKTFTLRPARVLRSGDPATVMAAATALIVGTCSPSDLRGHWPA
jgi:IS4 transposase